MMFLGLTLHPTQYPTLFLTFEKEKKTKHNNTNKQTTTKKTIKTPFCLIHLYQHNKCHTRPKRVFLSTFSATARKKISFCKVDSESDVLIEEGNFVEDLKQSTSIPRPQQVSAIFIL